MPILVNKLKEMNNFKLVKINIDQHQELAEKLNISSIPAVFLFYKGNVVDTFIGFPDNDKLNKFFESVMLLSGLGTNENMIKSVIAGAAEWMKKKEYDRAESMLYEGLSHKNWGKKFGHIFKLGIGKECVSLTYSYMCF
jgi:thioredoxin-like negative regulator of GroEL